MKKIILCILCAAVFFIGLSELAENTGANFNSEERALILIKQAQTAIGGEKALKGVKALTIQGAAVKTYELEGESRTKQIELEMNMQFPNKFAKTMKLVRQDNATGEKTVEAAEVRMQRNAVVKSVKRGNVSYKIKGNEGDTVVNTDGAGDVTKFIINKDLKMGSGMNTQQYEVFRTALPLLLTAPQGIGTTFNYVGDGEVDGNNCDVVEAVGGNLSVKLFLDKSSHLPRMISYQGFKPMIFKRHKNDKNEWATDEKFIIDKRETAEFQIKFSDYRTVSGVLLPYRWTQTMDGNADEIIDISNYEINPENIAEKFQNKQAEVIFKTEKKAR